MISYVVRKVDLEGNTLGASHSDGDRHPASSQPHPALALLQVESCSICQILSRVFVNFRPHICLFCSQTFPLTRHRSGYGMVSFGRMLDLIKIKPFHSADV